MTSPAETPEDWTLGCGHYADILDGVRADLILTSPPYNIGSRGPRNDAARKYGSYAGRSYAGITGYTDNLPEPDYQDSQVEFLRWAAERLNPGGVIVYNHKNRRRDGTLISPWQWLHRVADVLAVADEVVWDRCGTHNHGRQLMWPQTERLYVLRRAQDPYTLDNHQSRGLPQQTDVWRIPVDPRLAGDLGHCAPYPTTLAAAAVLAWSQPGDLVADPYTGSGTTAIAALSHYRRFAGAELDPDYHAAATRRITAHTAQGMLL